MKIWAMGAKQKKVDRCLHEDHLFQLATFYRESEGVPLSGHNNGKEKARISRKKNILTGLKKPVERNSSWRSWEGTKGQGKETKGKFTLQLKGVTQREDFVLTMGIGRGEEEDLNFLLVKDSKSNPLHRASGV